MITNLEKYKKDLKQLIDFGKKILYSFQFEIYPEFKDSMVEGKKAKEKKETLENIKKLPSFSENYQKWYSESLSVLKQLLPERVDDFVDLYKKPKTKRKDITHENYVIEDALIGLEVSRTDFLEGKKIIADKKAAFPKFQQQIHILESLQNRFVSSLFDIQQLVQADLFDSELDAARELNKKGFLRASGAIVGVVLEKHLQQVCANHSIGVAKKNPSISDLNDILKKNKVYETETWRKIQLLGDLRNLCDHNKKKDPESENIDELINGVDKIIKTIF